ncbi:MAG TPA: DUF3347 domain-containing protein [Puia sp.]|uniref:DUF3347 domain-containing protein n=1 Tax=Puia sp. TaxID=2045100 RepID=UPI00092B670D|nr:DUF3347 domain-containing protein [Puia sp.]MBN8852736.1 DUF3347 domain-containing protein [Sphingobacteriales bacterium]OJW55556.1 MAG: hypothetical protein BGO55_03165 [Sphingobacteriales bacterium 50-39]HVU96860.1 DUF3347 domain-containing protein [Puia sp.]
MKTLILSAALFASISFSAKAGDAVTAHESPLTSLLSLYYNIKNALIASDANTAAAQAGEFVKAINAIDMKSLSAADMNAFMPLQEKLAFDAKHIAETKEISHQREHFQSFSSNFYKLAKAVKLSDKPVYQDYCPMKKAYWLSSETAIKNPYFGSQMLTCGKISDTIK